MSQIDGFGSISYSTSSGDLDGNAAQIRLPTNISPLQSEMVEIQKESLIETMESMSLVMGSRLRGAAGKKAEGKERSNFHEMLMELVPDIEGLDLMDLGLHFSALGEDGSNPLAEMKSQGLSNGAMVLLLISVMGDPSLEKKKRKKLDDALSELLEEDDIGIDIFSFLEMGSVDKKHLLPIKNIYERCRQNKQDSPQTLMDWLKEIHSWQDKQSKIRVIIRALSLDLRAESDKSPERILFAIHELKRLLLFYSLEDVLLPVALSIDIPVHKLMFEVINILEQSWVFPEWLEDRTVALGIRPENLHLFYRNMLGFLKTIPHICFQDDDHFEQIIDLMTQMQDKIDETCPRE